jgi:hypothetical protein
MTLMSVQKPETLSKWSHYGHNALLNCSCVVVDCCFFVGALRATRCNAQCNDHLDCKAKATNKTIATKPTNRNSNNNDKDNDKDNIRDNDNMNSNNSNGNSNNRVGRHHHHQALSPPVEVLTTTKNATATAATTTTTLIQQQQQKTTTITAIQPYQQQQQQQRHQAGATFICVCPTVRCKLSSASSTVPWWW